MYGQTTTIALLVLTAALVSSAGCDKAAPRRTTSVHVAKVAGAMAPDLISSYLAPRLALAGQTRPLLGPLASVNQLAVHIHADVDIEVGDDARLAFAYGLRPNRMTQGTVRFTIVATQGAVAVNLFEQSLPVDAYSRGWIDATVKLDEHRGRVSLEFMTEFVAGPGSAEIGSGTLGLFAAPIVTEPTPREVPNVILVSLDTLRAKSLETYGYDRETAPFMTDYFGKHGIVVDRAYSPAADTLLGHTAMLYGRDPAELLHKITAKRIEHVAGAASLADAFQRAGYRTAAFTENANVAGDWGFSRGFELYDEEKGSGGGQEAAGFIRQTFDRGLEWIKTHKDEEFFVFLHTYEVHSPYEPPESVADLFPTPDASDAVRSDIDAYDREIRHADSEMRRLVVSLDEAGVLDDSILIVTSDHGEEFNEHGGRYHGAQLYEEVLSVPLFIRAPGRLPAEVRRSGPVVLQDLYPTLCELVSLECPDDLDGMSLVAHLRDATPLPHRRFVAEAGGQIRFTYDGLDRDWTPPSHAVIDWPWKLHRKNGATGYRYELYNLEVDPGELDNRYVSGTDPGKRLREFVDRYEAAAEAQMADMLAVYGVDVHDDARPPQDAARDEKLRALGYIE